MTSSAEERALRVLALDGGGIRGLSELIILKEVMHLMRFKENEKRKEQGKEQLTDLPKPCDQFDLIGGTGTGGIIALLLGRLRMDVDKAIDCYYKIVEDVFSRPKRWGGKTQFDAEKLEDVIKSMVEEELGNSESPLLQGGDGPICRTFLCSKNAHSMNRPVLFRTYESRESPIDPDCKIWQAARATSAYPKLLEQIVIGRGQPFVDGGLGFNNPTPVLLEEVRNVFPSRKIGCLISIGAGLAKPIEIPRSGSSADVAEALKEIALDCDTAHQDIYSRFANSPNTYFRFNVDQGMQDIELSEWEKSSQVEAHTKQYMKDRQINELLAALVAKMRSLKGELTAEQFIAPRPPQSAQSKRKIRRLPLPVPSFTGRRDILDKIHGYFDSDTQSRHIFVLHGLGGAGKTQIALKFLDEAKERKRFSDIFYVDAINEKTLKSYLSAINPESINSEGIEESAVASLNWLAEHADKDWLLFFDNADDTHLKLRQFFPRCKHGNILITTRNSLSRIYGAGRDADMRVQGMDQDDATDLLLQLSGKDRTSENEDRARPLTEELYCFALAIAQAGAYIKCRSISLERYQKLYSKQRDGLLQHSEDIEGENVAVYATWKLSYDQLDEPARAFLQVCSLLHHEGISEEMFERASQSKRDLGDAKLQNNVAGLLKLFGNQTSGWNSLVFQGVVDSLAAYSLIEFDNRNDFYTMHLLVQHWVHATLDDERDARARQVLGIISLSVKSTEDEYVYQRVLLQHVFRTMMAIKQQDTNLTVASWIAMIYSKHGYWAEAEALHRLMAEETSAKLGVDSLENLLSLASLGATYQLQGRWKEAEVLQTAVVEKMQQILGNDHPATLLYMGNLAAVHCNQGQWKKAEALGFEVVERMKQRLGNDDPRTVIAMANLAVIYQTQGQSREAEALQVQVVAKKKLRLGDDHPETLAGMATLARIYNYQGWWKEAEEIDVVVLDTRKERLGDSHPDTLESMENLAVTYQNHGQWKEAEALQLEVMKKREQKLGYDHPHTLISMGNLAVTYSNQGKLEEAEKLTVKVVEKMKQKLENEHPEALTIMGNLAMIYQKRGQWKDAEALQVLVVETMKQKLGNDHRNTLNSMGSLAVIYENQDRMKEAEALQVVVMEGLKQKLGNNHPETLTIMGNLSVTYQKQGRLKEAETLQVEVMEKMKQILGDDHPDTLWSIGNLAATYRDQGEWKKAEGLQIVVVEKRKDKLGHDHPDTLQSMRNLAFTYRKQGQLEEAEALEAAIREKKE